jgi:hypothetical protein
VHKRKIFLIDFNKIALEEEKKAIFKKNQEIIPF